ncbi:MULTISPECIES: phage tail protein [Massilia]|uniref:Phage tail protein n=2 Tax=Massilia TaxID=149698 RepID=A0ABY4ABR3_9BURK|nr:MULTISPECIES: tail fiber protein [Massilia]NHZ42244.1 phage tail protein [Massilia aquatica]UOD32230.1 phage tail protein [Massilia violaceinigra]
MSEPFFAEIRMMSFNFPPKGWAVCNGQLLPINQNQALFSLLGTQYGGNGQTNFALPDLRGRVPVHTGAVSGPPGSTGGQETVTLAPSQLPVHAHALNATTALATSGSPANALAGKKGRLGRDLFAAPANQVALNENTVTPRGGSQAHSNMQPFLTVNFVIALQGIFPSPN